MGCAKERLHNPQTRPDFEGFRCCRSLLRYWIGGRKKPNLTRFEKLYGEMRKKSIVLAVILGTFFGPLGLIYSTVTGAVVLIPLAIILGVLTPFALGALLVLPVSFVWAIVGTVRHNRFVEQENRHRSAIESKVADLREQVQKLSASGPKPLSLREQAKQIRRRG